MNNKSLCGRLMVAFMLVAAQIAAAQQYQYAGSTKPAEAAAAAPATAPAAPPLKAEELEQLAAPIALYPDSLLAQVLMASTYPLEIVQADRAAKENPALKDNAAALNEKTWDPSVKSLINFPQVLTMMSEKLDWTVKLGDAFIADQKAMMDAVQRLRNKAYAKGNLKTNEEQKVSVQPTTAPAVAGAAPAPQVIVVESASPSVVYVPTYNPTVVYGGWPYPSYPPYNYYPPGYVAGTALVSFGIGVACGAAWGHAWGNCNWNGGDVDIDIDKNVNFNGNIDREAARANQASRQANRDTQQADRQGGRDTRQTNRQGSANSFQHDPSHRQGVAYRDSATTEKFKGANASRSTAQARESYRGRTDAGQTARTGSNSFQGGNSPSRTGSSGLQGGNSPSRTGSSGFQGSGVSSSSSGARSSSFGGVSSGGSTARAESSRGQASRSSSSYSGSSRSSAGASRSGGSSGGRSMGGSRGGGGRGGGGRR